MQLTIEQIDGLIRANNKKLPYSEQDAMKNAIIKSMSDLQLFQYLCDCRAYSGKGVGYGAFVAEILRRKPANVCMRGEITDTNFNSEVQLRAICAYAEYLCGGGKGRRSGKSSCRFQCSLLTSDFSNLITTDYSNWSVKVIWIGLKEWHSRNGYTQYYANCTFEIHFHLTDWHLFLMCWRRSRQSGEGHLRVLCKDVVMMIALMLS